MIKVELLDFRHRKMKGVPVFSISFSDFEVFVDRQLPKFIRHVGFHDGCRQPRFPTPLLPIFVAEVHLALGRHAKAKRFIAAGVVDSAAALPHALRQEG